MLTLPLTLRGRVDRHRAAASSPQPELRIPVASWLPAGFLTCRAQESVAESIPPKQAESAPAEDMVERSET